MTQKTERRNEGFLKNLAFALRLSELSSYLTTSMPRDTRVKDSMVPAEIIPASESMSKQKASIADTMPLRYVLNAGTLVFGLSSASFWGTSPSFAMAKKTLGCPKREHRVVEQSIVVVPKATMMAAHGMSSCLNAAASGAFRSMSVYLTIPVSTRDTAR